MRSKSDRNEADFKDFDFEGFESEIVEEPKKKQTRPKETSQVKVQQVQTPVVKEQSLESKFKKVLLKYVLPGFGIAIVFTIVGVVVGVVSSSESNEPQIPVVELKEARSVLQEVSDIKDSQIAMLQKQIESLGSNSNTSSVDKDAEISTMSSVAKASINIAGPMFNLLLTESFKMDANSQEVLKSDLSTYMPEDVVKKVLAGPSPTKELKADVVKVGSPIMCVAAVNSDNSIVYLVSVSIASNDATYNAMYIMTANDANTQILDLSYVGLVKSEQVTNVAETIEGMQH